MSILKVIPRFLPNKGISLNKPEEFLKYIYSPHSRNVEFSDEFLKGRLGLTKFDAAVLSGPILHIDQYWLDSGSYYQIFCTTKDIYKYDFGNSRYDILTPLYQTGRINIGTGPSAMLFAGTTGPSVDFTGGGVHAGDYLKIGTGPATTADSWFAVGSVSGVGTGPAAILTMTTGPAITLPTGLNQQYTIRKCFQGSSKDFWFSTIFDDSTLGKTWIATNGVDTPIRYTGGTSAQALSGLPSGMKARYITTFGGRVVFGWTVEGGLNQPQRGRWSDVANCESYQAIDFKDFTDDDFWITAVLVYSNYLVFLREGDAYVGRFVGGDYIFDFEKSTTCQGCYSGKSVVAKKNDIYYYGIDQKFHRWNLLRDVEISDPIQPYTKDINPDLQWYIYGWEVYPKNQIRWAIPYSGGTYNTAMVVFDYNEEILEIWEYAKAQVHCSIGEYLNVADLYVDDAIWGEYYVDEQDGFWDQRIFLANAPVVLYGGDDGIVRKADVGYDDDGETYTRTLRFIRDNLSLPHLKKRLWKQQWWLESETAGDITIKMKKDDSNNYEVETKTISLIDDTRDIIKKSITWNKEAQDFQVEITSTSHFSLLGFLNMMFPKAKTYK